MKTNNNTQVEALYRKSNDWLLKCAYNFTRDREEAEELVQEVYLYLLQMENIEKIKFGNALNLLYIYRIIKSKYLSGLNKNKTTQLLDDAEITSEEYDYLADEEFERVLGIVNYELGNESDVPWFDKRLLNVYLTEGHSLTSLSKATKISRSACWNSINKTKKYLKNKV